MPLKLAPPKAGRTPYWWIRGTYLGCYCERSSGTGEKKLAAQILRRIERDIERGVVAGKGEPGFAAAAAAYMRAGGDATYMTPLIQHFGAVPISSIRQIEIDNAAAKLYPAATPATLNRQVYTPLSAVLKRAGQEFKIRRPKGWRGQRLTTWLTPAQAESIFRATAGIDAPTATRTEFRILLRMLCYTGMRLSEPLRLDCRNIDLKAATANLMTSKGGQARLVHLPPVVVAELKLLPRGLNRDGRLFRFHAGGRLRELFAQTLSAAGVTLPERVAFHVFCHTWATWMRIYGGLDTWDLTMTDRWGTEESANRYAHVVLTEQARKADLLPGAKRRIRA